MRQPRRRSPRARRRRIHPLVTALVTILATVCVTYYAFNQGVPFVHHFTVYAVVNNSVNVRQDSPVRIAGIDVGSVSGVSPVGRASKIAFTLNSDGLPIHKNATVRIRDRLFLEGGYYLELDPGSPSAPTAPDGYTIPESQTTTPVQFYSVLSTFDLATRTTLNNLLGTLNQGFSPRPGEAFADSGAGSLKAAIPQLTPVLKDVAVVTQAFQGTQPNDVNTLLNSTSSLTSTLADNSSQLADLVRGLNITSSALASTDGALAQTVSGIDQTLVEAPASLAAIDRALPPVAELARVLDPSLRAAPPLIDAVTGTVQKLAAVVAPVERSRLLTTLKATFQQFPTILTLLAATFPITKQVTDCLQTHVTPILKQQVPDGPLSSGRPVWQDFVHFLPGLSGASGSFDGNGPYTRALAGAGTNSLTGGVLGSIPILGQLVGSAPPGGTSLLGARPAWIGTLTSDAFHPEAPCATQKVPSLSSPTAAADMRSVRTPPAPPLSLSQLKREMASAAAGTNKGGGR